MPLVFRVGGVDIGNQAVRLGAISSGFISRAEKGTIGSGGLPVDDPGGTLNLVGLQTFTVDETSSSGGTRLFTGYMQDRTVKRGAGTKSTSLLTTSDRLWDCNIVDLNFIVGMRVFQSAKRPNESVTARLAWLMGTPQMSLVHDHGYIGSSGVLIGANDFSGNYPVDVLNDVCNSTGWDYYIFYDQGSGDPTLFCNDATAATRLSTMAISNVLADQSSTVLYPLIDGYLLRDPARVFSGVLLKYTGGQVYEQRTQTAEDFIARDIVVSTSHVGEKATAITQANQYLTGVSTEFDRISCTLKVPASQVDLIDAGMRINAKFSHLPGYTTGKNMRIALRQVKADEETDQFYNMYLELVTPISTNFAPFGNGSGPDIGPIPPVAQTQPACLTALGGASVVSSSDGTYPIPLCGGYTAQIGSRLFCHDESVGNPCGLGNALFWGSIVEGREQHTLSYTVPTGAVIARVTAHVTGDGGLSAPPASGSSLFGAHGWQVQVYANGGTAPNGWYAGETFIASTIYDTGSGAEVTADLPANLFDGTQVYFISVPSWREPERFVCGSVGSPFPGGDYLTNGAVDTITFMGFCNGATGQANWVGGVGTVDGNNTTFALVNWDGTGQPQAKVNGLPTPVTVSGPDTVSFSIPPAAGSLVTFQYQVNQAASPAPPAPNPGSIQALLDADVTGTVTLPLNNLYSAQTVQVRKANQTLDMNGSVLDSTGQTIGIQLTASGTTVKNGTVKNCNNPLQTAAVQVKANGCTVNNMTATLNAGAGIGAGFSQWPPSAATRFSNATITGCTMDHNTQEGYFLYFIDTYTFTGNTIHDNNPNGTVPSGWEAGGGKILGSTGGTVTGNTSHHNTGPGMWWDTCPVASTVVSGNTTHHNWVGIKVEVSGGFTVHDNALYEEGWTSNNQGWGWAAGLLFSTTINCEAYNNTLGWNNVGASVIWQPFRVGGDAPASNPTANYLHNNLIAATDVTGSGGGLRIEGWYEDGGGTAMFTDHTNKSLNERFYSTLASPSSDRYEYNGPLSNINAYQVTVGGNGATEVSVGVANAALTAAGIPLTPEHT